MAESPEKYEQGKIIHIDTERDDGVIRLGSPEKGRQPNDVAFKPTNLRIDHRYIDEVISGMKVKCIVEEDEYGNMVATQVNLLENMVYNGFISSVKRLSGLAEVKVKDLETTIVFCRTHLEVPDEFQKIREGDPVQVEIGFFNFVSKRKPPRPNKVILMSTNNREKVEFPLRPALRRSTSTAGERPKSAGEVLEGTRARPRSSSHESRARARTYSAPDPSASFEKCFPGNPPPIWNRSNSPLITAASFFHMPPFGQFQFITPAAGWLPQPPYLLNPPGAPPPPGTIPHSSPVPPQGGHPPPGYSSPQGSTSASSGSRSSSSLSHPENFFGFGPDMDDSDVVLEMTVNELRDLMRNRPR